MDRRPSAFWRRVRAWGIVPLAVAAQAAEGPGQQEGREKVSVTFNLLATPFTGQVRGRARTDGTIALSLETMRSLSYVAPDGSNDGGISEGGAKAVDVRPGEAVRVEVPDPVGGVTRDDPRASRMARDLAGRSFAIVCRVRPLS